MGNSHEEIDIIRRTLRYCEAGTTHMESGLLRNPVSHYANAQRLAQEQAILFREFPIVVGHVSQLASAGDFFTHDETGVPMLVTRTRQGAVKAFMNVCRHRGARIVTEAGGNATTFSCPYHAWTYDLEGRLRGLRQPAGFADLDKSEHGLIELPAFERYGMIWVRPSVSEAPISIDAWLAPMAEQLASADMASLVVHKAWSVELNMGWRIALEGFQESYHFCSAHKQTACSAYLDNQSVFVDHYPHFRHAVPLAQTVELQQQPEADWDYRANYMDQNYLFPCNFVQVMTDHVFIHSVIPMGPGKSVFKCIMLVPDDVDLSAEQRAKKTRYWEANYNVVCTVFGEDFAIGEGIQQGLSTGVNEHFVIGQFEAGIQLAEKAISDALDERLVCPQTLTLSE
jgi:phenylpropionate dioxygenase-like ring-hydroxylating dioxygenase large terminal subunit